MPAGTPIRLAGIVNQCTPVGVETARVPRLAFFHTSETRAESEVERPVVRLPPPGGAQPCCHGDLRLGTCFPQEGPAHRASVFLSWLLRRARPPRPLLPMSGHVSAEPVQEPQRG